MIMKKNLLFILCIVFASCSSNEEEHLTTDFIKGTVWVEVSHLYGLTNVSVLTFISNNECELLFAGTTVNSSTYQCNYIIENNKIVITPINGEGIFECTVEKDELLMYQKLPVVEFEEIPSMYKRIK